MNKKQQCKDRAARQKALHPGMSFIVEAPAGSGKTELLVQRYLKLLSCVRYPEEILAMTFTRQATHEMRVRVVSALKEAQHPHALGPRVELAKNVLKADQEHGWHILSNPECLRITTIDAFGSFLNTHQVLENRNMIDEQDDSHYIETVLDVLNAPPEFLHDLIMKLLIHTENDAMRLTQLLVGLLKKRDQWLLHLTPYHKEPSQLRFACERFWSNHITSTLGTMRHMISDGECRNLEELAQYAASVLRATHPQHALCHAPTIQLGVHAQHLSSWQAVSIWLLTAAGTFRTRWDQRQGFTPSDPKKKEIKLLIDVLKKHEKLLPLWNRIRTYSAQAYSDEQAQLLEALVQLLPYLAAALSAHFQMHHVMDFTEQNIRALHVLGYDTEPSDVLLHLDNQIQHILIDEFQDISMLQFTLLQRVLESWSIQDTKTLFLVGDPKQSIYGFRNAVVDLFLHVQKHGIASVPLQSLTLYENFRSNQHIVHWINQTFKKIFLHNNVVFSESFSNKKTKKNVIHYHLSHFSEKKILEELCEHIHSIQTKNEQDTCAILARNRSHFEYLLCVLKKRNIAFQSTHLENLYQKQEVLDLFSLTQAVCDLSNHLAWMALLRTPWIGLRLMDLEAITRHADGRPIWWALNHLNHCASVVSEDAILRLKHVVPILTSYFNTPHDVHFSTHIKNLWKALLGPRCLTNTQEMRNATAYLQLLDELRPPFNFKNLVKKLQTTEVPVYTHASVRVQIMTLHQSKGLEFDHVFIPELHKKSAQDEPHLMNWIDFYEKKIPILMGICTHPHESNMGIYGYIRQCIQQKQMWELQRLLYVGATRARKSVHWYAHLPLTASGQLSDPSFGTLLALLWPEHADHFKNGSLQSEWDEPSTTTESCELSWFERLPLSAFNM